MRIVVLIERLILDGLAPGDLDAAQIQAAVEAELARLLIMGGINPDLASGGARAGLSGGGIGEAHPTPQTLGAQIAGAVYHSIGSSEGAQ